MLFEMNSLFGLASLLTTPTEIQQGCENQGKRDMHSDLSIISNFLLLHPRNIWQAKVECSNQRYIESLLDDSPLKAAGYAARPEYNNEKENN
jgi:hypothetical protein